jgi:hypothetical protein
MVRWGIIWGTFFDKNPLDEDFTSVCVAREECSDICFQYMLGIKILDKADPLFVFVC